MVILVVQKAVFSLTLSGSEAEKLLIDLHIQCANKT